MRKPICGVGINDADYVVKPKINGKQIWCPIYKIWKNMLERCYDKKRHAKNPTYIGSTVSESWLTFSNFKKWMESQDYLGKELDKDIIVPNNKHYSPETCVFVTSEINLLLTDCGATRGKYPIGVSFSKGNNKYVAQCSVNSKHKNLGYYNTPEEASQVYNKFKVNHIRKVALEQDDDRVLNGLFEHAKLIENKID